MTRRSDRAPRRLTSADAAVIAQLHASVSRPGWSEDSWAALIADPLVTALGVEEAGQLVGGIVCRTVVDEVEILMLVVAADMQRRGIGGRLLEAGLAEAIAREGRRVVLEVDASNMAALSLYRRFGFVDAGRRTGYYSAEGGGDALLLALGLRADDE